MILFADDSGVTLGQGLIGVATTTAVGLLVAFGDRLKGLVNRLFDRLERPAPPRVRQAAGLRDILRSHDVMQAILELPYVNRVLMFEGANGGSMPQPGKAYSVRCIGVMATANADKTRRLYEGPLVADVSYLKLLIGMAEKGLAIATVADLPEQSMLRMHYAEEGVFESAMFWLASDEKTMSFLSVANYERKFSAAEVAQIHSFVIRLRGLMGSTITIPDSDIPH